ncbi:hypothetical protein LXT21_18015 [Myxococcus sp. K38C18041901]|uniref:hypothetical protein n=1 Tax=Myxococcus guangdongensis TaxID=2906760 RepID=UPI0020A72090|nr:hypothetical protein [Myxococcus guangdongensis]MCP3060684.1 hypothetical protein [Myxococcus guangdongensis]
MIACLLTTGAVAATPGADQLRTERRGDVLELRWADAEERLQGTLHPALPREGEPAMLSLHVGAFQGAEFTGPLTLTLHLKDSPSQLTRTLTHDGVNWHTQLEFDEPGLYELEVRYQNTRLKVLTGFITVASTPLPRGLSWALVIGGSGLVLALGVRGALKRLRGTPAPTEPSDVDAPPAITPPVEASASTDAAGATAEAASATAPAPDAASNR